MSRIKIALGVGGVPPSESAPAFRWERRLRWLMAGVALLSVPAFYLEEVALDPLLRGYGHVIEVFIVAAFSLELGWMLRVVRQRLLYLRYNWLDLLIILCSAVSLLGAETELIALGRLMRFALLALLLLRAVATMRGLFLPGRIRYLLLIGIALLMVSGAGFYWLEPTIKSFGDGLWLAFVTGATVGYGDVVPTTVPSRLFAVLSVLVGFTLLSVMTAYVASILVGEDEKRLRREMHNDIRELRESVARMVDDEERAIRRELNQDIRRLQDELAGLRADLQRALPAAPRKD
jgi:voltage-gated potassium channel